MNIGGFFNTNRSQVMDSLELCDLKNHCEDHFLF